MSEEEPFFVVRNGAVWACWLSGRAAVKLGAEREVLAAMQSLLCESGASAEPGQEPSPVFEPPVPASPPAPAPPSAALTTAQKRRHENERIEHRHDISITGHIRSGLGTRDVTVLDLSERGCRFHDPLGHYSVGARITIKLGPIGPIGAYVRWSREEFIGIQFDNALYPSVLDHIRQHFDLRR